MDMKMDEQAVADAFYAVTLKQRDAAWRELDEIKAATRGALNAIERGDAEDAARHLRNALRRRLDPVGEELL